MKRLYAALTILILVSLFFAACSDTVGLGMRLNLKGPIVTILNPQPDRDANQTDPIVGLLFALSGTVESDARVALMTVTLDYWNTGKQEIERMGREWRWENIWMTRESDDSAWKPYTEADYNPNGADPNNPVSPPSWALDRDNVRWNLPVSMDREETGEYFITVSAWDATERHGSESAKKLKIKYVNKAPTVKIRNPAMHGSVGSSLSAPRPPDHTAYVFDPFERPDTTSTYIRNFTNDFRDLSYLFEGEPGVEVEEFSFEITNEHNLDNPGIDGNEKKVYYSWEWTENGNPPTPGIFTDDGNVGDEIQKQGETTKYTIAGGRIVLTDLGSDPQGIISSLPADSVTPMQLVTRVKNGLDLEEYKSKGWFFYLPASDKPYTDISFGNKVPLNSLPTLPDEEWASMTRGTTSLLNYAYDDDGLQSLEWELYKLDKVSNTWPTIPIDKRIGQEAIKLDSKLQKESWSFRADRAYGVGNFKIVVRVRDSYDTWGDWYQAYFKITSNSTPTVLPWDSSLIDVPLWGGNNGKFTISGKAQIEDKDDCDGIHHDVRVDEVAIVWMNPEPDSREENNFRYNEPSYSGWDDATENGFTDDYGNKVWKVAAANISLVPGTEGNKGTNDQEEWAFFSKELDLFADLGIGKGKLPFTGQEFRVRVLSEGTGTPLSSVDFELKTMGDDDEPVVEITHVIIQDVVQATLGQFTEYTVGEVSVIPAILTGDKVKLRGTWSDDSIGQWTGLGNNRHNEYINDLVVSWEGANYSFDFGKTPATRVPLTLDGSDGGNWETGWHTFTEPNIDPSITLTVSLTDLGEKLGTDDSFIVIATDNPTLTRISSVTPDGYYGNSKDTVADVQGISDTLGFQNYIDIFLEFNNSIKFCTDEQESNLSYDNAPRLLLNNGGEAFYLYGNDSSRFYFRYFVNGQVTDLQYNTGAPNQGGSSTPVDAVNNPEGRLHVTGILFSTDYPKAKWISSRDEIPVIFPETNGVLSVCNPARNESLVGQKRIIIDKDLPELKSIVFNAGSSNYGKDSQIYIYAEFTENIQVTEATEGVDGNTYLNLKGGNLGNPTSANPAIPAKAWYDNASSKRITFLYTVGANHDTSAGTYTGDNRYLGVSSMAFSGASITDAAGNSLTVNPTIPAPTPNDVIIDTTPPTAPVVADVVSGTSYYYKDGTNFRITGLEDPGVKVQYHLDYPAGGEEGWTDYSGTISPTGQTGNIKIEIGGIYNIAARQYDTAATTPNLSPVSTVRGPVRVDTQGGLLERITSSMPDGDYSANTSDKNTITIDLEFRIPVTLDGSLPANTTTTYLALNTSSDNTHRARLTSAPANSKTWTFTYQIPNGATTDSQYLDVKEISLGSLVIRDQRITTQYTGTQVNVNNWISLADVLPANRLNAQKKITVTSGRPQVTNPTLNNGIQFTGTQLSLTFNKSIYRGNTASKLIIRQISGASTTTPSSLYQIPAVLSEERFNELFRNRSVLFQEQSDILGEIWSSSNAATKAERWLNLGNALYQKGSNGANSSLVSDTTVKYVLKYDVDPNAADDSNTGITGLVTGITTMLQLRTLFRAAEALTFGAFDSEVGITNNSVLTINLGATGRPLPVKGARYEWVFPNGFVKDALGTANGTGTGVDNDPPTGNDTNLTSQTTAAGARVLFYSNAGVEAPIIRINKGSDIETFYNNDTSANRKARQPLTSNVKINSRTPGVTITYSSRQTTDNVSSLIMRDTPTATGYQLPNRNNFNNETTFNAQTETARKNYFDNTRMRPQSGQTTDTGFSPPDGFGINAATWRASGLRTWVPMVTNWPADVTYTPDFEIGTTADTPNPSGKYSDGGMIIHIRAIASLTGTTPSITPSTDSVYSFEAAYRSVFVYINQNVNSNTPPNNARLNNTDLDRVWIRGSDKVYENPTTPDFPISRDASKWRKIRQLTPVDAAGLTASTVLKEGNIRTGTVGYGQYLWFWVTWKINVPAFLNIYYGELPSDAADTYQVPRTTREITKGSVGSLEHFPVIPGRTTVVETKNTVYQYRWYGYSGDLEEQIGVPIPTRTD